MRTERLRRLARPLLVTCLASAIGVTTLAQRGGYQGGFGSYSANNRYDGKFTFVRISYPDVGFRRGMPPWSHDYPQGEEHFMKIMQAVTTVPLHVEEHNIMSLSDPDLFKFPLIYLVEPGTWSMSDEEALTLRAYLLKGGFMIIDDMRWNQWANLELQMSRVLPQGRWEDIGAQHTIFHSFYEINQPHEIPQYYDPGKPIFRGIYENNDPSKRLMVFVNYNTDISEFWEWSDQGYKPIDENNEAYKIGINEFVYGIIH
jgi:hypothetical protein